MLNFGRANDFSHGSSIGQLEYTKADEVSHHIIEVNLGGVGDVAWQLVALEICIEISIHLPKYFIEIWMNKMYFDVFLKLWTWGFFPDPTPPPLQAFRLHIGVWKTCFPTFHRFWLFAGGSFSIEVLAIQRLQQLDQH